MQNNQTIPLSGFIKPVEPSLPIYFQFEQKFSLMAPMCDMPYLPR